MLGWKVEECHEFLAVLLQAQRRLGVFGPTLGQNISGQSMSMLDQMLRDLVPWFVTLDTKALLWIQGCQKCM